MGPCFHTAPLPSDWHFFPRAVTVSGHREPFEAGSGRDPLLSSVLLPQPPAFPSTATVTFLCPFGFSRATSPEAEEDLETMSPVILGTLLKHRLGLGTV